MASSVKRKDETNFAIYQPGMTQAKRPTLFTLNKGGSIDLKRLLTEEEARRYARGQRPVNNRGRLAAGLQRLREIAYAPGRYLDLQRSLGEQVEIIMGRDNLQMAAKQTKKRTLWGDGNYTADSDIFTALVHQAFLPAKVTDQNFTWSEAIKEARCIIKINDSLGSYPSASRNGVCSRVWPSACYGCSFEIIRMWVVAAGTPQDVEVELDRPPEGTPIEPAKPFFLLSQFDHRISTRGIAHGGDRRRRTAPEVATVVYSLANEPWLKYNYACISDCGFGAHLYTSSRFAKEVLYLETQEERFELAAITDFSSKPSDGPRLRFCKCKDIMPEDMLMEAGTPLPSLLTEVLFPNVPWENMLWGTETLQIKGDGPDGSLKERSFRLARMRWLKGTQNPAASTRPTSEV